MTKVDEFRAQHGHAYDDMSDSQLADALYRKSYSDMPRQEFDAKMGLTSPAATAQQQMSQMTQHPGPAIAEQRRQQDVAQYEALPGWQKPIVAASDILQTGARFPASMLTRAASYIPPGFGIDPEFRDPQTGQMPATPAKMITPEDVIARLRTGKAEGPEFEAEVAKQKRQTEAAANRSGWAGTGAEVLATAGLPIAKVFGAGRPLLNLATTSAGYGALSEDDPLKGAAAGLAGGTVGYYGGKLISKAAEKGLGLLGKALPVGPLKVPAKAPPITPDDFKSLASAAYDEAESHGVVFNQQGLSHLKNRVKTFITEKGYHPKIQPNIAAVLETIDDYIATGNATQRGMQTLREIASGAYDPMNKKNNLFVDKIIDEIDNLSDALNPRHMAAASGDPRAAAEAARYARLMYHKGAKLQTAQDLIASGELQGDTNISKNVRQTVRKKLATVVNPLQKKTGRGFSALEKEGFRKAVNTTTAQDIAHSLSGWMPRDKLSGAIAGAEMLGHAIMAGQTGGASLLYTLPMSVARMGIGAAADKAANRMAQKSVDELVHLIATGQTSKQAAQSVLQKLTASKRQAVMQGLGRLGMGLGAVAAQPLNEAYLQNEQ